MRLVPRDSSRELPCPFILRAAPRITLILSAPLVGERFAVPTFLFARWLLVSPLRFSVYTAGVLRLQSKGECAQDLAAAVRRTRSWLEREQVQPRIDLPFDPRRQQMEYRP